MVEGISMPPVGPLPEPMGDRMDVTEVRVFPVQEDRLRAYVTVTFDHCFVVRDLKVINGNNGLFVAMPSKKRKDGTYRDTAHPLDNRTRQMIETRVLAEYTRELHKVP
jgi:stage V sporulation protein G